MADKLIIFQGIGAGVYREVLQWPYTIGGGGPPPTKVTMVGNDEITVGKIWSGHFWYPPPLVQGGGGASLGP